MMKCVQKRGCQAHTLLTHVPWRLRSKHRDLEHHSRVQMDFAHCPNFSETDTRSSTRGLRLPSSGRLNSRIAVLTCSRDGRRTHANHRLARLHRREAAAADRLQRPSRKPQCTGKPELPAVHRTHCGDAAGAANCGRAAAPNPAGTPTAAVGSTRYCAGKGGAKLFASTSADKDIACVRYHGRQEDDGAREAAD